MMKRIAMTLGILVMVSIFILPQILIAAEKMNLTYWGVQRDEKTNANRQAFVDKFKASESDGILWLHGYGNVFEKTLGAGEQIDIEPGGWLYKDPGVKMETTMQPAEDEVQEPPPVNAFRLT